jgi:hypothetical protein
MVDLHSPTAPTIARKEAARTARKAYGKRKTRQVAATRVVRASKAEKNDPQGELQGEPPAKKGEPQVEPCACEPSAEKNAGAGSNWAKAHYTKAAHEF